MENKHTQGRWTVGTTESSPDNCKRAMVFAEFPYDMQETICVLSGLNGTEPGETAKANAKLIAAAPILYNSAYSALQAIYAMPKKKQAFYQYLINDLLNAIQKANGTRI